MRPAACAPRTEERFLGSIIGQSLGDALGFVVEGYLPSDCAEYVEQFLRGGQAGELSRPPYPFGQYTDDSQLARELLSSYVARRKFDPQEYATRIASIFYEKRIVGWGRATAQAARRLLAGVSWEEAGTPPPSAGNGSAMRAGPIGLIFHADPPALVRAALDQGRITHRHPRCGAGAVAIAGAVALAYQSEQLELTRFVNQLAQWVAPVDEVFAACLHELRDWQHLPPERAVTPISRAVVDPGNFEIWQGISPYVVSSVLWSLYSFLRSPGNYWETICTAIAVGGDVDTTAAMAGAISGAYVGLPALPRHLTRRLTDQGTWGYDELLELGRQCHRLVHPPA